MSIKGDQINAFKVAREKAVPHYSRFYGMTWILEKITAISYSKLFNVHLDHGILMRLDAPDQYLANAQTPLIFVDNSIRKNMVAGKENVQVLGPLFIRYRRKFGFAYNTAAKGTIVFPTHSSHHLSVSMDWAEYARQLRQLSAEFHPITVCLYWIDVLKGEAKYFEDEGLDVISIGHMFEEDFSFKFYSALCKHKYATGNEPGSFTFYAVEMGMPFFIFGPSATIFNDGADKTAAAVTRFTDMDYPSKVKSEFTIDPSVCEVPLKITEKQKELVYMYIDEENWISLGKLRYLLVTMCIKQLVVRVINKCLRTWRKVVFKIS